MNRRISDSRVLKDGAWAETEIGSPQGGVISPLLCNIYLDAFDQEMKAQEIRIVRYADDILIFARSARQAERYQAGWISYFRLANCKGLVEDMMGWIRRRLRMKQMREWKGWKALHRELRRRGYQGEFRKISMRRWPNSASPLVSMALPNQWFDEIGLVDLTRYEVGTLHRYYEVA